MKGNSSITDTQTRRQPATSAQESGTSPVRNVMDLSDLSFVVSLARNGVTDMRTQGGGTANIVPPMKSLKILKMLFYLTQMLPKFHRYVREMDNL